MFQVAFVGLQRPFDAQSNILSTTSHGRFPLRFRYQRLRTATISTSLRKARPTLKFPASDIPDLRLVVSNSPRHLVHHAQADDSSHNHQQEDNLEDSYGFLAGGKRINDGY